MKPGTLCASAISFLVVVSSAGCESSDGVVSPPEQWTLTMSDEFDSDGDELATNGDFETGTLDGWTLSCESNDGFCEATMAQANSGSWSGNVAAGPGGNPLIKQERIGIGMVQPNSEVAVQFALRGSALDEGRVVAELFSEVNGGGSPSKTEILGGGPLVPTPEWVTYCYTVTTGDDVSGGVTLQLTAECDAVESCAVNAYFDDVTIKPVSADRLPSSKLWTIETGYGPEGIPPGWGNDEWQLYTDSPDNLRVDGCNLVIAAQCPEEPCGRRDDSITSARIKTQVGPLVPSAEWVTHSYTVTTGDDVSGGVTLRLNAECGAGESCEVDAYVDDVTITTNGEELAANGGFETGTLDGWTPTCESKNETCAATTLQAKTGDWSGNVVARGPLASALIKQEKIGIGIVQPNSQVTVELALRGSAIDGGQVVAELFSEVEGGGPSKTEMLGRGFEQKYGRIEARIKLPDGQGFWPAFWMLGANIDEVPWPGCGEIDVMEFRGQEPDLVAGTLHGPGYFGAAPITAEFQLPEGETFVDDFHVFAVEWDPGRIAFSVDGEVYQIVRSADVRRRGDWVFDHEFFVLLNLAVGGGYVDDPDESTVFPGEMLVDYVRMYERAP